MSSPVKSRKAKFSFPIPKQFESSEELTNLTTTEPIKANSIVNGVVIDIKNGKVIADIGLKSPSEIPISEFSLDTSSEKVKIGDVVELCVLKIQDHRGRTILSRSKAIEKKSWVVLEKQYEANEQVEGVIFEAIKGGYKVDLSGVLAFLPGSQVDMTIVDIAPLMNIVQPFKILKMDKETNNIIISRKILLQESKSDAREELLSSIKEGMTLEGKIKNITDYGAFVDLGCIDGLVHLTDMSWQRINHPSELVSIGQTVKVKVIKFQPETKRISLGIRQLDNNAWEEITKLYPVGFKSKGKITNIANYGAFIELNKGFEGLVHVSEISWASSNQNPRSLLTLGDIVNFVVTDIDEEKHRISLSIKQCKANPWERFTEKYKLGDTIKCTVKFTTDYGINVKIDDNVYGFIHSSQISWDNSKKTSGFKVGESVDAKLIEIDATKYKANLSIKQTTEDPYKDIYGNIKTNDTITCVVKETKNDGICVMILDALKIFIPKHELAIDKVDQKVERFTEGDKVDAKIIYFNQETRILNLSIKALETEERKKAISKYGSTDSGSRLGDILGAKLTNIKNNEKTTD